MNSESRDIVLFQQGDVKAFDEIFYQYYPSILYFAMKLTGSREAAEEIVMDSFKKLWTRKKTFESKSSIKAWLMITTKNACYNHLYAEKRKSEIRKEYAEYRIRHTDENPMYTDLKDYRVFKLLEEINKLPPQRRTILKLRLEGYTNPQISEILNISAFTVKKHIAIAFKTLKISLLNIEQLVFFILLLRQLY